MATTVWVKLYLKEQMDHNQATRKIEGAVAEFVYKSIVMRPAEEKDENPGGTGDSGGAA